MNDPFNSTTIPLFQMATFDGISAEDLGDAIKDEAHSNVVLLVDLWVKKPGRSVELVMSTISQ